MPHGTNATAPAMAVACALAAFGQPVGSAQSVEPPEGAFRSRVDLVTLAVTVREPDGAYVTGLDREQFAVFEEGVRQPVEFFGAADVPVDLVLMLDTSSSMTGHLQGVRQAAINFTRATAPRDRVATMSFGTRTRLLTPFTTDRGAIEQSVAGLSADGDTALYDAVYIALHEFDPPNADEAFRRRAVVVLSDGYDTTSLVGFNAVVEEAWRVGVAVYVIALRQDLPDPTTVESRIEYEMRTLAEDTGARAFFPETFDDLNGVYRTIATELRHQYAIGYVAGADGDAGFRRLMVRVDRPGVRVRTRAGYVASD